MSSVAVGRLRNIAKTVRQLPSCYRVRGAQDSIASHYFLIVDEGAKFIREAEALGAFQGDSIYGQIGEKLAHPSCHSDEPTPVAGWTMPLWKLTVWYAVVDTLKPELKRIRSLSGLTNANGQKAMRVDTSEQEAAVVAGAIDREADRIEAEVAPPAPHNTPGKEKKGKRKGKPGRKPNPKITRRNNSIIEMLKAGKTIDDVTTKYADVSAANARRIKSDAGLGRADSTDRAES